MELPENDYQILKLTDAFYDVYQKPFYSEILQKRQRPYTCLLFQIHYNYFICIPFRSEISHTYSFKFKKSKRSQKHKSGLDYTKIMIICKTEYLDNNDVIIDKDEFSEMIRSLKKIKSEALTYVENYVEYMKGNKKLGSEEFNRRYAFSTLVYFHKELGI